MLRDTIQLLWQGVVLAAHQNGGRLAAFAIGGVAAALVCFFLCSWFSRLFNRQIQFTASHYAWCAFAALVTIILSIALAGVMRLGDVARLRVAQWAASLREPAPMSRMWEAQYHALESAGYRQTDYRPYNQQGGMLHTPDDNSEEIFTRAASAVAMHSFDERNPVLHHLIKSGDETAIRAAVEEMKAYFKAPRIGFDNRPIPHDMGNTVAVLGHEIEAGFSQSIPGFQRQAIIVAIIIVALAQAIPIILAGLAAYQQINVGGGRPAGRSGRPASSRRPPPSRPDRRRR